MMQQNGPTTLSQWDKRLVTIKIGFKYQEFCLSKSR